MHKDMQVSDESLVVRICDGDHRAFALLVERHTPMFYKAAYRICGNDCDAQDSIQDAFLKLWQRPYTFDSKKGVKFTTWFYRVVTNIAIDRARKYKPHNTDALETIADNTTLQDEALNEMQKQTELEAAIQKLPERQKLALNLCVYEELSQKEAAHVLNIRIKALESLLMRAKKTLKQEFKNET